MSVCAMPRRGWPWGCKRVEGCRGSSAPRSIGTLVWQEGKLSSRAVVGAQWEADGVPVACGVCDTSRDGQHFWLRVRRTGMLTGRKGLVGGGMNRNAV